MDKEQLKGKLKGFQEACASAGRSLNKICLEEAYPGDDSTTFVLEVTAPWMDDMACYPILQFLTNKLFETTDVETRKRIFYIRVLDSDDQIHCFQDLTETIESRIASV